MKWEFITFSVGFLCGAIAGAGSVLLWAMNGLAHL